MCCNIIPMFKHVFDRVYNDAARDDRVLIQKNTYMLEWMGLNLGNFCYLWDNHGPYSLDLKGAIQNELSVGDKNGPNLSPCAQRIVASIKAVLAEGEGMEYDGLDGGKKEFTERLWMELICSIHFLKHNTVNDGMDLLDKLRELKQYFNNREANKRALAIVNFID